MDDRGEIISSCDVDEDIALQIWTKGLSPRVVIFNKNLNKKKFVKLRWFEILDRKLTVNGKKSGTTVEYALSDLLPAVRRILSEYAVYTAFKPFLWRFSVMLERVLHAPAVVFDKKELSLLSEEKRARLWLADLTGGAGNEGFFRPFFPLSEAEKGALPENSLRFAENCCGVEDLLRTGAVRRLNGTSFARWLRPVRIAATAMLLGFSFCEEDGEDFSDDIWRAKSFENSGKPLGLKLGDPRLKGLGRKIVGYVRHFDTLDTVTVRASFDSDKELQEAGYTRKRRVAFPAGLLGRAETSVTFFEREDGMMAFGCKPKVKTSPGGGGGLYYALPPQKSQEKQELIYTIPKERYEAALLRDSFMGAADDYFTVGQLAGGKIFEAWSENIVPFISYLAGFVEL
jgi:hypothetical protein